MCRSFRHSSGGATCLTLLVQHIMCSSNAAIYAAQYGDPLRNEMLIKRTRPH